MAALCTILPIGLDLLLNKLDLEVFVHGFLNPNFSPWYNSKSV